MTSVPNPYALGWLILACGSISEPAQFMAANSALLSFDPAHMGLNRSCPARKGFFFFFLSLIKERVLSSVKDGRKKKPAP